MTRRSTAAAVIAVGLVLTACGTSDDAGAPSTDPAPAAPATDPAPASSGSDPTAEAAVPAATETEPTASEPAATAADTLGTPAAAPAATAAPAAVEPTAPVEAQLGGRAFASELAPASDFSENLLPRIQVDDVRRGMQVNLANIFPAERPVLLWMWAPH